MIDDGNEKRNRELAFELQNSHVCEKRSKYKVHRSHMGEKSLFHFLIY